MLSPAQAITATIKPSNTIINSSNDAYIATLDPTGAPDLYYLNITIPAGYNLTLPQAGRTVGNYTMLNTATGANKVIINITSNDPNNDLVDVTYSTNYGASYSTNTSQNISNISIGAATLRLTRPGASAGYLNISLAGAGPITTSNTVTITLANGTLTNPGTDGAYTWYLEAKNDPAGAAYTSSDVVSIKAGASSTVGVPVFNASMPANASLPLPSGNLTVNITTTQGVNLTNLVITLRNFTSDPNSSATAGASGLSRIMFIGVDAPALSGVSFTATIRVNYTSVLSNLTIPETNLRLYRFNDSTSTWELTASSDVDTVNKIVYGNVTGFSTFAVMGAAAAAPQETGGSGGGGGGGGGGTSGENFTNIIVKEKYDLHIFKDKVTSYRFTNSSNPILFVNITGNVSAGEVNAAVEVLRNTSSLVKNTSAPGVVYKNVNIWVGTSGFAVPRNIKEGIITFRVENAWMAANNVHAGDISMLRWENGWNRLETREIGKNETFTYYESKTRAFSPFAIAAKVPETVPVLTPQVTATPEEAVPVETTPEPAPSAEPLSGLAWIYALIGVALIMTVAIAAEVYFFVIKGKK